ncbi:hypothetical protein Poli38472_006294 [Pythium oligandrum]|uniref:Uncharacterized protein n=1 Tax=Pythium oligandrum TaxID=41045 RepID=A0A8K1CS46_PYTOL|nr:hypothetical protein Poli38472_006294 [Pythium oligandrum]|eukprot:TMW68826.1 hypothetical protein Poli38472_006294 [Pythium oligandrum]
MMVSFKTPMSALGLPQSSLHAAEEQRTREKRQRRQRMTLFAGVICVLFILNELIAFGPRIGGTTETIQTAGRPELEGQTLQGASTLPVGSNTRQNRTRSEEVVGFRNEKKIAVLLTSVGDTERCARTLAAARDLAFLSTRIYFRVFEELSAVDEESCLQLFKTLCPREYAKMVRTKQLRFVRRDASGAMGPSVSKHIVEGLVEDKLFQDEFYLSVDANTVFTKHWDLELLKQWYLIGNTHAILSVSPPPIEFRGLSNNTLFVQCSARIQSTDPDAIVAFNPPEPRVQSRRVHGPVLHTQYSELFHFGTVSSLQTVRSDPYLSHLTVGHEYMRATRFWTHGFDFYTPSKHVLYRRYEEPMTIQEVGRNDAETQRASRRIRRLLGLTVSFSGEALEEVATYSAGAQRSLTKWRQFSGIDPSASYNESTTNQFVVCGRRLHYVHYAPATPLTP